jgi:hypothetical protein
MKGMKLHHTRKKCSSSPSVTKQCNFSTEKQQKISVIGSIHHAENIHVELSDDELISIRDGKGMS